MICNYVGVENLIASLKWNGETGLGVSILFLQTRVDKLLVGGATNVLLIDCANAIMVRRRVSSRDVGVLP